MVWIHCLLGILFGYLQACAYLENFIMGLRTASPGTRALGAPGTRSPPPPPHFFLFQAPNSAGLSNWGLSARVAGTEQMVTGSILR